jgi:hypothetical protein
MSNCSTQAYASFKLADPSVSQDQILTYIRETINTEARSESFDAESAYGPLAETFDYDAAFDALQEDDFDFSEHLTLSLKDGFVDLEGVPLLNEDDHVTRWFAWVLFRQFGEGDVLTFSNKTIEDEGTSGCIFKIDRNGTVDVKTYFVK